MIAAKDEWIRRYAVFRDPITCYVITAFLLDFLLMDDERGGVVDVLAV